MSPLTMHAKARRASPIASNWAGGKAQRACPPTHLFRETCLSREGEQYVGKPRALKRELARER